MRGDRTLVSVPNRFAIRYAIPAQHFKRFPNGAAALPLTKDSLLSRSGCGMIGLGRGLSYALPCRGVFRLTGFHAPRNLLSTAAGGHHRAPKRNAHRGE